MVQFKIQTDSSIPVSRQLLDQIHFAIASGQYPPGDRLPSTRQLSTLTGLHRNTINKVYRQLEQQGLVHSVAGSGIYVAAHGHERSSLLISPLLQQDPQGAKVVKKGIDELLSQGYTLKQIREFFLSEIDWRLGCSTTLILSVPYRDINAGKLMMKELEQSLAIPITLVPLEELGFILANPYKGTVVTSRYFIQEVLEVTQPLSVRVIPIDIYDYAQELALIKKLPPNHSLGIVSSSIGTLGVAETIINSLRGEDLRVISATIDDKVKLRTVIYKTQTIISDLSSYPMVKKAISLYHDNLMRIPNLISAQSYIGAKSIEVLKKELGITSLK